MTSIQLFFAVLFFTLFQSRISERESSLSDSYNRNSRTWRACAFFNASHQSSFHFQHIIRIADAETDNVVGNQPAFPNRRPSSKSDRIQPNQYLVPQTPQQTLDEPMYREQQLQWPQLSPKQTNSIWPEKPGRKSNQFEDSKSTGRKQKVDMDDSEYSEEYVDENRIENNNRNNNEEVSTTTAAPQKKVLSLEI